MQMLHGDDVIRPCIISRGDQNVDFDCIMNAFFVERNNKTEWKKLLRIKRIVRSN